MVSFLTGLLLLLGTVCRYGMDLPLKLGTADRHSHTRGTIGFTTGYVYRTWARICHIEVTDQEVRYGIGHDRLTPVVGHNVHVWYGFTLAAGHNGQT